MTDQVYSESNNDTAEQPISQPIAALVPRPYVPQPYAPQPYTEPTAMLAPTARNKAPRRRNAARKPASRARGRYRNAAPARAQTGGAARKVELPPTFGQKAKILGTTLLGAIATSFAGVAATRLGFHPGVVSGLLGGGGLIGTAISNNPLARAFWGGTLGAGGSQFALLALQPGPTASGAPTQAAQLPAPAQHKNAELGTLPPGALDAAFERARSALAVEHNPEEHADY